MANGFSEVRKVSSTRKPHVCDVCEITIPPGSQMIYQQGKYDGEYYRRWTCITCARNARIYEELLNEE